MGPMINVGDAEVAEALITFAREGYLAGSGEDYDSLMARDDDAARKLLAEASRYASDRLSEIALPAETARFE
jgi:hypothetical protein